MKHVLIIAALTFGLAGLTGATPAAAASRNFDCSKPANANKTACKPATHAAAPAAKAKVATRAATKPAAPKAKPVVVAARTERSYDCSKAGNKGKAQCKSTAVAIAKPVAPARRTAAAAASSDNQVSAGAIARCKDGLYSHAARRGGACSRHGGVASWMKG